MDFAKCAVVDNDFINHLIESRMPDDEIIKCTIIALNDFGLSAIMHPLVYQHEVMKENSKIMRFFNEEVIACPEVFEIFQDNPDRKDYYLYLISVFWRYTTGKELDIKTFEELWKFWEKRSSLGEIHSLAMCLICGSGMFLSDDKGSKILKNYISDFLLGHVNVYNRDDFFKKHKELGKTNIGRDVRRSLSHERCN